MALNGWEGALDAPIEPEREPVRATRREWLGLAVLALPCALYAMDLTVLNLALPTLSRALRPSSSELLWIIDIYGFMVAGFLITMGTLGDRIGRRRLLLLGAGAFGVASLLAALARTPMQLIALRAVLGVAGATIAPSTLSLIRTLFRDDAQRRVAIGVWMASYSVGGALGPPIGGFLLEHASWSAIFLAPLPIMTLLLVLGPLVLPEYRAPQAGPLDLLSCALSLLSVLALVYGFKHLAEHGPSLTSLLAMGAGIALAIVFVRRQRSLRHPLLDLSLFALPTFTAPLAGYGLGCFATMGVMVLLGQYLQLVLELSPFDAGLWLAPWAFGFVTGSLGAPTLARHVPVARAISVGLLVAALGIALIAAVGQRPYGPHLMALGSLIAALGMSPLFTLGNDLIQGSAPPERAGAAAALSETSAELSGALGIALFGSLGMAVYRGVLGETLPAALPPEVASEVITTLGRAQLAAEALSPELGALVRAAANAAFYASLRTVVAISAVLMALIALYEHRQLKGVRDPHR